MSDDWNLPLLTTKKSSSSPHFHSNVKNFNNLRNPFSISSGGLHGHSSTLEQSGPNFGSDYGSLLELQNAKQRIHSVNVFQSNSMQSNSNVHNSDSSSSSQNNYNHFSRNGNNVYSHNHQNNHYNNNNNRIPQQANKHRLVIALSGATKNSWEGSKDTPHWNAGIDDSRKISSMASGHDKTNDIQVLRTDKESKVVVPAGMIAILVPQNFGITAASDVLAGNAGNVEFDDYGQSFYESSSTTKKTVLASPAVLSDISSNSGKIEPSKSPGPPYKVDFTQGLPPNAIAKPDFLGAQIQSRMGSSADDTDSFTSANEDVSIKRTSVPIVLSASSKKQLSRKSDKKPIAVSASLSKSIELPQRVNSIRDQIHPSFQENQPETFASVRPTTSYSTSTTAHLETTRRPIHQHSAKYPRTRRPKNQTRQLSSQTQLPNDSLHNSKKLSTSTGKGSSITALPPFYSQYQTPPRQTTPSYLSNHKVRSPPTAFPPPAFDSESAGTYLPRAEALKRTLQKGHKTQGPSNNHRHHHHVPEPSRSSQTFSFHGSLQPLSAPNLSRENVVGRIGRSNRRIDSLFPVSDQKDSQHQ